MVADCCLQCNSLPDTLISVSQLHTNPVPLLLPVLPVIICHRRDLCYCSGGEWQRVCFRGSSKSTSTSRHHYGTVYGRSAVGESATGLIDVRVVFCVSLAPAAGTRFDAFSW